jgi:hypothetical protein
MKYWLVLLIIVSIGFFSLTVLAFTGRPHFSLNDIKVTGRVVLQGRDEGNFGDITIRVLEDNAIVRMLTTSANGSLAFDMEPGTYRLEIIKAGWQTQTRRIVISRDDVDLRTMKLLLAGEGTCPGAITGLEEAPQITDVTSAMAPNNNLIFDFNVEVDKPARVWVEYHPAGDDSTITRGPLTESLSTDHQLQVMRLRSNTNYCYQVLATSTKGGSGEASDSFPGSFVTGPLPAGLADSSFRRISGEQTHDLTLLDFNDADFIGLVAIDKNAEIVWYYEHNAPIHAAAQDENGHLIIQQIDGVKLSEIRPDGALVSEVTDTLEGGLACGSSNGRWHHEVLLRPVKKVYFLGSEIRHVEINGVFRKQTGDIVMVWDRNKGTVSTLASLFDLLDPRVDRTPVSNTKEGFHWRGCADEEPSEDWTHANSMWIGQQGNIILSMRHLGIVSVSPDFESVQWRLGGPRSDFSFPNANDRFYQQHTARELPNGNILLFDNGNSRPPEEGGEYSRALELELDFTTMEARKVWEYRHRLDLFAQCCSSIQRLANGNTLVVFGYDHTVDICCRTFTLVEVDSQGNAVSVIEISSPGKNIQYRAYALDSINGEFTE